MSNIEIIKEKISKDRLNELARAVFSDMVKVVVDVERGLMAAGGEMPARGWPPLGWHADCEQVLLDDGSKQKHLWGANIYPDSSGDDFIEYLSLINIRPAAGNRSMEIEDEKIRNQVKYAVNSLVE